MSKEDLDKKGLDKRVRALTALTKENEIPALAVEYFDSTHPVPAVCVLLYLSLCQLLFPLTSCGFMLLTNSLRLAPS
jgi:hypothetical protein